jgi:hypothetical protein
MDSGPVDEPSELRQNRRSRAWGEVLKAGVAGTEQRWTTWAYLLNINHYRLYSGIARDTSFTADVPEAEWRKG